MVLRGDRGLGYVRLDWFTPDGLGTWGDGRLFILGTEGYIEVRKYTDVAVKHQGNNLFIVDKDQARYIDCNQMPLPFGPEFVAELHARLPKVPVLVLGSSSEAPGDYDTGFVRFLTKPFALDDMVAAAANLLSQDSISAA